MPRVKLATAGAARESTAVPAKMTMETNFRETTDLQHLHTYSLHMDRSSYKISVIDSSIVLTSERMLSVPPSPPAATALVSFLYQLNTSSNFSFSFSCFFRGAFFDTTPITQPVVSLSGSLIAREQDGFVILVCLIVLCALNG